MNSHPSNLAIQKYQVNQYLIESVMNWVVSKEIAIPEIQRPFVWKTSKVRDLIDSLYQGFPVGYLISWRNPDVRLKDGSLSHGKKILIDGQQRVTALTAALLGQEVVNDDYKKVRIKIAFHPIKEIFEVSNPAISKSVEWFDDISPIVKGDISVLKLVKSYCSANPSVDEELLASRVDRLKQILKMQIGFIDLEPHLDIEVVTEIFIRINSQGVVLSQSDFAMSKLAADSETGSDLRKCIDYFCHLSIAPEFYTHINENDAEFIKSEYFQKIKWLKDEKDDLYDPDYRDVIRVAFTSEFSRGPLSDLVSLISGRNFATRSYEQAIAEETLARFKKAVLNFVNETNFKRFVMIVKSAGFTDAGLITSTNTLNFAYILYLKLRGKGVADHLIEKYVRRWLVLSLLTGRYVSSPESKFDEDAKRIDSEDFGSVLSTAESGQLSAAFWEVELVQELDKTNVSNPYINVFFAAQIRANDLGLLSSDISVRDLISHRGDIHHIFPKAYLKQSSSSRKFYNQIANFAYTQSEINIKVGKKSPKQYFGEIIASIEAGKPIISGINSIEKLMDNFRMNCIPENIINMEIDQYAEFTQARRRLMADKIKAFYFAL